MILVIYNAINENIRLEICGKLPDTCDYIFDKQQIARANGHVASSYEQEYACNNHVAAIYEHVADCNQLVAISNEQVDSNI